MPQEDLAEKLDTFIYKNFIDTLTAITTDGNVPKFVIDNDSKADWAIRKIIKYQNEIDNITALAKERIEQTKKWQEGATAEIEQSIQFFQKTLEPYAKSKLLGKSKTVKLPAGNISFHSVSPEFFIAGEKVSGKNKILTERVEKLAPELIIMEKSTDWTEFKNTLTVMEDGRVISSTGEILDFIEAVEYPDSLTVKERK